jgi:hypothetical protein
LEELESWAKELSFTTCILETGKIPCHWLYKKNGYHITTNMVNIGAIAFVLNQF